MRRAKQMISRARNLSVDGFAIPPHRLRATSVSIFAFVSVSLLTAALTVAVAAAFSFAFGVTGFVFPATAVIFLPFGFVLRLFRSFAGTGILTAFAFVVGWFFCATAIFALSAAAVVRLASAPADAITGAAATTTAA